MSCTFSRELLALHVDNDLPETDRRLVSNHLQLCTECIAFLDQLVHRHSQLKLRRESVPESAFVRMRRDVLSQIENSPQALGWTVRIERALWLGFHRQSLVFTSLAIAAVSATVFAQMRHTGLPDAQHVGQAAVFTDTNSLLRPAGYREWISIGSSASPETAAAHIPIKSSARISRNTYIDRTAYLEYSETGRFREGTVLILETEGAAGKQPLALVASVKDSRFEGGWGFFDFTNENGELKGESQSLTNANSCRTCHEQHAKSDHVFTQFHPALKTAT